VIRVRRWVCWKGCQRSGNGSRVSGQVNTGDAVTKRPVRCPDRTSHGTTCLRNVTFRVVISRGQFRQLLEPLNRPPPEFSPLDALLPAAGCS